MLTDDQVKRFEKALQGPPPAWDPGWEATQQLLKLVTIQAREMINLQAQLDAVTQSTTASSEQLFGTLRQSMGKTAASNHLTPEQVQVAVNNLDAAIKAATEGQRIAGYAGNVLKFVAKLII